MASVRRDKAGDIQRQVAQNLFRMMIARQYSPLAVTIEMLAKSNGNVEIMQRLEDLKENCTFEFENEIGLYLMSFARPPYRGVRFRGMGIRYSWQQIREIGTVEIHKPMMGLCVDLIAKVGESQTTALKTYVEGLSQAVTVGEAESKEKKEGGESVEDELEGVIFDNE